MTDAQITALVNEVDANGDGEVNYEEFVSMIEREKTVNCTGCCCIFLFFDLVCQ
jgi:hypothetical protein